LKIRNNNDQHFCWEQIGRANRLFRISHLFAPQKLSDQLLALYALFASIELISDEITEELVAYRKLDWWRAELLQRGGGDSQHPVIRHLNQTGAMGKLPASAIGRLLESAGSRLDAMAPLDQAEFKQLCNDIYAPQLQLESALGEGDMMQNSFADTIVLNGGLIQLLRGSVRRKENAFWWIPLSSLARFKINRQELYTRRDTAGPKALFNHVFETQGQPETGQAVDPQANPVKGAGLIHLNLMNMLQVYH